jgi:hypothetical protein
MKLYGILKTKNALEIPVYYVMEYIICSPVFWVDTF